jgi:hypothetical protein
MTVAVSAPILVELEKLWYELEFRKCAADPEYFIRTYVWVESRLVCGTTKSEHSMHTCTIAS